jgi:hypothetical protein
LASLYLESDETGAAVEVFEPLEGLLAFTTYAGPIDLTFIRYLLRGREPLLVP